MTDNNESCQVSFDTGECGDTRQRYREILNMISIQGTPLLAADEV